MFVAELEDVTSVTQRSVQVLDSLKPTEPFPKRQPTLYKPRYPLEHGSLSTQPIAAFDMRRYHSDPRL